jgi:hypothetical protein
MALRVNCTMCGASIVADDLAIRRKLTTCAYCSTILRITEKGTQEYKASITQRAAPRGVTIKREGSGNLLISAGPTKAATVVNKRELKLGARTGLIATAAIGLLIGIIALLVTISSPDLLVSVLAVSITAFSSIVAFVVVPAVITVIWIAARSQKTLPPLKLKDGIISSAILGNKEVAIDDIRQIY